MSEGGNQSDIREHYARMGVRLWRNNSGVLLDKTGRPVRFGLANDSKEVNEQIKSGDLIGWRPRLITPDMVGGVIAEFWSVEVKPDGWKMPRATNRVIPRKPRERMTEWEHVQAQLRWAQMLRNDGGVAGIMIDPDRGFEPY